jgi:hypothetical protein
MHCDKKSSFQWDLANFHFLSGAMVSSNLAFIWCLSFS